MRRFSLLGGLVLWLAAVGAGFHSLQTYEATPGTPARPPGRCPADLLPPAQGQPLLLMFAHPRCPCTRASLDELARLTARFPQAVSTRVVFAAPAGSGRDWNRSGLWRQAAAIPGVQVVADPDGLLARRFDASTSGQVLLYSAGGHLLFHGGITASRGHEGDNDGSTALLALIAHRAPARVQTPVFGCPLYRRMDVDPRKAVSACRR